MNKDTNLVDLGSSPGGWSQVASKLITKGKIYSIDIKDMDPIKNVKFLKCDIFDLDTKDKILNHFNGNLRNHLIWQLTLQVINLSILLELTMEAINFSKKSLLIMEFLYQKPLWVKIY